MPARISPFVAKLLCLLTRTGGGGARGTTEESEAYPLYRYEDEMAARKLVRAGRAYIARRVMYILRRNKLRYFVQSKHKTIVLGVQTQVTWCSCNRRSFALFCGPRTVVDGVVDGGALPRDQHTACIPLYTSHKFLAMYVL